MAKNWIVSTPASIANNLVLKPDFITLDYITFVANEKVIICTPYHTAVPIKGLDTHLRTTHRVPLKQRRITIAQFEGTPTTQTFNNLVPCKDRSTPLSYLLPPAPRFCCPHCTECKTISWEQIRKHMKGNHNISAPECTKYSPKYWTVTISNKQPHSINEEGYLAKYIAIALDSELEHNENTEWLRGCEWPIWFANKPIHLIIAAATRPSADTSKDLVLGLWNGFECVSPAETERVI
ncbi:hypothetical protein GQ44DRAFT_744656 [Phaeosphaeriaceae sp. PMI808]|nr:hypothetical protein GQ44DRAFT_744656 [Phaeosphaeriaceae sp. PMI808]